MPILRAILLLCCVLFVSSTTTFLHAQNLKGIGFEAIAHYGKVVQHTEETTFPISKNSVGLELNWKWQTYGQKDWHEWQNYPLLGLSFLMYKIGEADLLGNAYGFFPHLTIPMSRNKRFGTYFQIGTGIAWLSTPYDLTDNPLNNAIGSHWNNVTVLKFVAEYRLNKQWLIQAGGSLTHFSNGGSQFPNFGINIPALSLGARYFPIPLSEEDFAPSTGNKKASKKWSVTARFEMAYREYEVIGGPRYPVYVASLAGLYHWNKINRGLLGVEYEYHQANYLFGLHTTTFTDKREARWGASRISLYLGNEFLFGNWSILLQAGAYVGDFSIQTSFPVYFKLSPRYYFPTIPKINTRFYTGMHLKTHLTKAEYLSWGIGVVW